MVTGSVDAQRPGSARAATRPGLPVAAAAAGLAVVAGAALAGPWQAAPRPVDLPAPRPQPTLATEVPSDLTPPPEGTDGDGVVPVMFLLALAAVLVLFLALRAFLNRATLARGTTAGEYDPAIGSLGSAVPLAAEPDLPALRRGVAAARQAVDAHAEPGDAVIAAWLELEKAAQSSGIARPPSATPTELTTAVLDATRADPQATRTLLGLYHRARFAPHAVVGASDVAAARRSLERIAASWEER